MTTTARLSAAPPARVTVVTAPACHFCHDALAALEQAGRAWPLEVTELDVRTAAGADLMARHGAGMSPLVLLDGAFVSAGRLPRNKLRAMLAARADRVAAVAR